MGLLTGIAEVGGGAAGVGINQGLGPHLRERRLRSGFAVVLIDSMLLSAAEAWNRHSS